MSQNKNTLLSQSACAIGYSLVRYVDNIELREYNGSIMGKSKTRISEKAAVQLLSRLFVDPNKDELTLEEVYTAAGRGNISNETNRNWLNAVVTKLREHSLVTTIDKYENSRTKLDRLKVTLAGKTALGWPVHNPASAAYAAPTLKPVMNYSDLAKAVASFRNDNPDFEVVFEVKLREVSPGK